MRPQRIDDKAVYQKHDWPDQRVYPHYFQTGHQASDSVVVPSAGVPTIEQTMDFGGDRQHQFGYFDANDAGQVVQVLAGWASIVMTQDGKGGVQWFIGSACRTSATGGRHGWLLFSQAVFTSWTTTTASLNIAPSASDCPARFNPAYTRYREAQITFPFRLADGNSVNVINLPLDVVVSEHFAGAAANPALDTSLERLYFARHLGMVRWERWENLAAKAVGPRRIADIQLAQSLVASKRCPLIEYSVAPGPGWEQVDCRTWTTIVRQNKPWTVKDYRWRAFEGVNW